MTEGNQKKIYLWTIPRSLSTAFLRSMVTVDKCKGMNEPYLTPFFKHAAPDVTPPPSEFGQDYQQVESFLHQDFTGCEYVFIKEMPAHMPESGGDKFYIPEDAIHSFLIRHPVKTLKSQRTLFLNTQDQFFKDLDAEARDTRLYNVLMTDQTFEPLMKVFKTVTETFKQKPIVVDADDLQMDPEGTLRGYCAAVGIPFQDSMVHWGEITQRQKQVFNQVLAVPGWESIIGGAVNGTEFTKIDKVTAEAKVTDVEDRYRERIEENLKMYEQLRTIKINYQ